MVLSKVGAIDSAEATEYLTSVLNGYQLSAEDAMGVVDALSQVDVKSASSVEDLAIALQKSANSARNAGVSFETLVGWIGEVKEVTQKSASSIGESFKTILSRLGSVKAGTFLDTDTESEIGTDLTSFINDTEKVLTKVGISLRTTTNDFRSAEEVINDVAAAWSNLTDLEKNAIATAMAGTRQRENFVALMDNYGKATDLATEALNSNGAAMDKYAIYQQSVAAGLERIESLWQQFIINMNEGGVFKDALELIENLMNILADKTTALILQWFTLPTVIGVSALKAHQYINTIKTAADDATASVARLKLSVAQMTIIIAAAMIALKVLDEVIVTYEESVENLNTAVAELNAEQENLSQLAKKLDETKDKINELLKLQEQGPLTLVQEQELENLQKVNEELRIQIALQKELVEQKKTDAENNANNLWSKKVAAYDYTPEDEREPWRSHVETEYKTNIADAVKQNIEFMKELKQEMDELDTSSEDYGERLFELRERYNKVSKATTGYIDNLQQIAKYTPDEEIKKSAQEALDSFTEYTTGVLDRIDSVFNAPEYANAASRLKLMAKDGAVSMEDIEKATKKTYTGVGSFLDRLDELGVTTQDLIRYLNEMADAEDNVEESTSKVSVAVRSYTSIIEDTKDRVKALHSAQSEMAEQGYVATDTVSALEKAFGDISDKLVLTEKGFILTKDAADELNTSMRTQYELELNNARNAAISIINAEGDKKLAYDATTESILAQLKAEAELLRAKINTGKYGYEEGKTRARWKDGEERWVWGSADLREEHKNDFITEEKQLKAYEDAITSVENALTNLNNFDKISNAVFKDAASKNSGKKSNEETAYERAIRLLEHELFLKEQMEGQDEKSEETLQQYLDDLDAEDEILRKIQEIHHAQAEGLKAAGKVDTKEYQQAQQDWWAAQDKLDANKEKREQKLEEAQKNRLEKEKAAFDKETAMLQHQLFLAQQLANMYKDDPADFERYKQQLEEQDQLMAKLQERYHQRAEVLREDEEANAEELIELSEKWWNLYFDRMNLAQGLQDKLEGRTEDFIKRLKASVNDLLDKRKEALDIELKDYENQRKRLNAIKTLTQEHFNVLNNVEEKLRCINNELKTSKESYKYLDAGLRETIFNEKDYIKLSNKLDDVAVESNKIYNTYLQAIASLSDDDMYKIEEITSEFQRQFNIKQKEYDIVKAELDLVKAQTELQNTLANRNVRMFSKGEWIWTSDYSAVKSAMEAVGEAENEVEKSKEALRQQQILDQYQAIIDGLQMQSDAAQQEYDKIVETWNKIQKSFEKPVDTIESLFKEISDGQLPGLKSIIEEVGDSLQGLIVKLNGIGKEESTPGYAGGTTNNGGGGSISYGTSYKQYLQNKVDWKDAMDKGDTETADKLNKENQAYRDQHGIDKDNISSEKAKEELGLGHYDRGGILKGLGGIKATNKDEVVFDNSVASKILDPERSREFLDVAKGLSSILDTAPEINSLFNKLSSGFQIGSGVSTSDSHDIYLNDNLVSSVSASDYDTITSVLKRYIPITKGR